MEKAKRGNVPEDFWNYVDKREDGHWMWTGSIDKEKMIGLFSMKHHLHRANRYVFIATGRTPLSDMEIVIPCALPLCINPDHMDRAKRKRLMLKDGRKECCHCREPKPLSDFYVMTSSKSGGTQNTCKECARKISMIRNLRITYGTVQSEYDKMFLEQEGVCALCGQPPKKTHLCVDHDHQTGRIRGLLCKGCNTGLGILGDTQERLQRAVDYLTATR